MKRSATVVFAVLLAFALTAVPSAEAKKKKSTDTTDPSAAATQPAKKHSGKKSQAKAPKTKKSKTKGKDASSDGSMFNKTLFDDPALQKK
jgi:hypothetical protein